MEDDKMRGIGWRGLAVTTIWRWIVWLRLGGDGFELEDDVWRGARQLCAWARQIDMSAWFGVCSVPVAA